MKTDGPLVSQRSQRWLVAMLFMVYLTNYLDRSIIGVLQEPIRREFSLTDFQLGLLGGPAFAIFYALCGLPLARLAEHVRRVDLLVICLLAWSAMTMLCGVVPSFGLLMLCRMGVGVGEAGGAPISLSILGDAVPADRRSTAISIMSLGVPAGALLSALAGGVVAEALGWRAAFIIIGAPGLVLALLFNRTIREPSRGAGSQLPVPPVREALRLLAEKAAFRHVVLMSGIGAMAGFGINLYGTAFFMRIHELSIVQASAVTGAASGIFGGLGTFLGGFLADRLRSRFPRALAWVPAFGLLVAGPLYALAFSTHSTLVAIIALMAAASFHYMFIGPSYALTTGLAPTQMRATAASILLLGNILFGFALGPPLLGLISDWRATAIMAGAGLPSCAPGMVTNICQSASAGGLAQALVLWMAIWPVAAFHAWRISRTLDQDWEG